MGSLAQIIFKDEAVFCELGRLRFGVHQPFLPFPSPASPQGEFPHQKQLGSCVDLSHVPLVPVRKQKSIQAFGGNSSCLNRTGRKAAPLYRLQDGDVSGRAVSACSHTCEYTCLHGA